jgi:sulfite reductase alpha subunit-like flavoprotein
MRAKAAGLTNAGDSIIDRPMSTSADLECPPYVVFFGCRNKEKDFFFRLEWEELEQAGILRLFTAFSRDQEAKV